MNAKISVFVTCVKVIYIFYYVIYMTVSLILILSLNY